jgi:site-specific DNA-methyltransferase (adenine-specific)
MLLWMTTARSRPKAVVSQEERDEWDPERAPDYVGQDCEDPPDDLDDLNPEIISPVLMQGDCLECLEKVEDHSVRAVIMDPPYGTTFAHWDQIIDFRKLWTELQRVVMRDGPIIIFANQPFTTLLIQSNIRRFKYDWVWQKTQPTNFMNVSTQPLRAFENICVFYNELRVFNPQKKPLDKPRLQRPVGVASKLYKRIGTTSGKPKGAGKLVRESYPTNILKFRRDRPFKYWDTKVETQKPVNLLRYLIRTYSNPGDYILDATMGSGSTGVAAHLEGRAFIGIEKDPEHFALAELRIGSEGPAFQSRSLAKSPAEQSKPHRQANRPGR